MALRKNFIVGETLDKIITTAGTAAKEQDENWEYFGKC